MKYVKAFIAGLVVPSILIPILLSIAITVEKPQVLDILFLHLLPIIWGIWNVLYFVVFKHFSDNKNARLLLTGAVLGFGVAIYGVFVLNIPALLGFPSYMHYVPLVAAPIVYAILWRVAVSPVNHVLDIAD